MFSYLISILCLFAQLLAWIGLVTQIAHSWLNFYKGFPHGFCTSTSSNFVSALQRSGGTLLGSHVRTDSIYILLLPLLLGSQGWEHCKCCCLLLNSAVEVWVLLSEGKCFSVSVSSFCVSEKVRNAGKEGNSKPHSNACECQRRLCSFYCFPQYSS